MINLFKKIAQLSYSDWANLGVAFLLLSFWKLAFKIMPFRKVKILFERLGQNKATQKSIDEKQLTDKILAINRISVAFPWFVFNCLPKAMALKHWMRHHGPLSMHIGVQKDENNQFLAHAWVSHNQKIIMGDDPNISYVPIAEW